MNIPEIWHKIKSFSRSHHGETVLVLLILIACSIISFYLGRSSIANPSTLNSPNSSQIESGDYSLSDPIIPKTGSLAAAIQSSSQSPKIDPNSPNQVENREDAIQNNTGQNDASTPRYVASRRGRTYYFTWCSGAKSILPENKVYFNSAEDARAAGLKPSSACPDLD